MAIKIVLNVTDKHLDLFVPAINHFYAVAPKVIEKLTKIPGSQRDFTYTTFSNYNVWRVLFDKLHSSETLIIETYRPWYPWSKAVAYTKKGSNKIVFNEYRLGTYKEVAGTIAHEFCHNPCGFTHGTNNITAQKEMSVPYAFGYLVSGKSTFPLSRYE